MRCMWHIHKKQVHFVCNRTALVMATAASRLAFHTTEVHCGSQLRKKQQIHCTVLEQRCKVCCWDVGCSRFAAGFSVNKKICAHYEEQRGCDEKLFKYGLCWDNGFRPIMDLIQPQFWSKKEEEQEMELPLLLIQGRLHPKFVALQTPT